MNGVLFLISGDCEGIYGDTLMKQIVCNLILLCYIYACKEHYFYITRQLSWKLPLKRANTLDKKFQNKLDEDIRFTAIPSNPCFELWLLIHFVCITKEIHRDKVLRELRHTTRLPNYEKGQNGYFSYLHNKLPAAFDHAKQLTNQRAHHSIENPYTAVGELVEHLIKLS